MRIEHLRLVETCRIRGSEHTHFSADRWDITLVDFLYFEVRAKNDPKVLAVIPFQRANYAYPAEEEVIQKLADIEPDDEEFEAPLLEVKRGPGRPPKHDKNYAGTGASRS